MEKIPVSVLEFQALLNLESMIRMAMISPSSGEFIAVAIQALDAVRKDESIVRPKVLPPMNRPAPQSNVSDLASNLISRAMKK